MDLQNLERSRQVNWGQTPESKCPQVDCAPALIDRLGIVTHYPTSPELPNLLHAYTGSPDTRVQSEWDSASGDVYTWRWLLGRRNAGFYTAIVQKRPTWVAWSLLPAVLCLRSDSRAIDEIYDTGDMSAEAYRVARALEDAGSPVGTGDLRQAAGFPVGKAQRNAYLKAVAELDGKLLVAKVFSDADEDMRHVLVSTRYPEHVASAEGLSPEAALRQILEHYLPHAAFVRPAPFAKAMGISIVALLAALDEMARAGLAACTPDALYVRIAPTD
jgi:hypothetical protein